MLKKIFNKFISNLRFTFDQIINGNSSYIFKVLGQRIKSERLSFVLKKDLELKMEMPRSLINIELRPYTKEDSQYFKEDTGNLFMFKKLSGCYVAVNDKGIPCFRIWMLKPSLNEVIKDYWGDSYPQLNNNEVLIARAFTLKKFRGLGIMSKAMALLAENAKKEGFKFAITITPIENKNSLYSSFYAGFKPYLVLREKYFIFKKMDRFEEIPNDLMEFYNKIARRLPKSKKN